MKRNKFSLSHYKLLTANQGQLIPCGLVEVLPGDTFQHSTSALIRVNPLNSPVMHPVDVSIHHWFVPHRLVMDDWEKFITGGPDGMDATVFPTITVNNAAVGSLFDYYGIPPLVAQDRAVSALPFRGYQLIFKEWYRDQDLVTAPTISTASGPDVTTTTTVQSRAWEKDYFTTARPWTQKGPEITIPLGTSADVVIDPASGALAEGRMRRSSTGALSGAVAAGSFGVDANSAPSNNGAPWPMTYDPNGSLVADLSSATAATINELRLAFALQRYEENRARYGSRYTEYLAMLGVRSSDARLQRPEYLGGGKQKVQFSEVLQTSPTTDGDDEEGIGNMKGHGIAALRSNRYRRFFEEHGYIHTFISVKPKTMYVQGIPRTFSRTTKEAFFQRELQHIGQQEIFNKEVYSAHATPEGIFGYQDRYDEYRRMESSIAGEFRTTEDYWHMARIFSSDPALNAAFINANPTDRVYQAGSTQHQLKIMANHNIKARRIVAGSGTSYIL